MIFKTKTIIVLILSLILMVIPIKASASPNEKNSEVYGGFTFYTENNNINLLVTSLSETPEGLILEGYIYNTTTLCFKDITDFNLELKDTKGTIFANQTFNRIDLYGGIFPLQGKKISLLFDVDSYDLEGANLNCISWNFKYNYQFYPKK